ncbi:unnamed protein product [Dovyalis caffra]|uniref:Uncharacterized protein n=1 Tax=Dovyalis caffra TaxID=77055 RepID=A0AAV1R998_9ROSI|nr:unnamed protein product [Dovyalis caffra]
MSVPINELDSHMHYRDEQVLPLHEKETSRPHEILGTEFPLPSEREGQKKARRIMADTRGSAVGCNDGCGCPVPCPGGKACRFHASKVLLLDMNTGAVQRRRAEERQRELDTTNARAASTVGAILAHAPGAWWLPAWARHTASVVLVVLVRLAAPEWKL